MGHIYVILSQERLVWQLRAFGMTWAMSHLRAFVANQVLSRIRALLGLICPDFYSDIRDFTQILCPKDWRLGPLV